MKKSERLLLLFSLCLVCAAVFSLFLPYVIRSDFREGYLKEKFSITEIGFYSEMAIVSIVLIALYVYLAFRERSYFWALFLLLLNLINLNIVRYQIHHQCCLDHDFDTQSGIGFYVLFFSSLFAFIPIILLYLLHKSERL